jgi:hypothetical protein
MTNEILEKLSGVIEDSDQIINSPDFSAVFVSQAFKSVLELNPHHVETYQSDISTDNLL